MEKSIVSDYNKAAIEAMHDELSGHTRAAETFCTPCTMTR